MRKTLILYACHEINECVIYFIKHGIFESENYKFVIICNNENILINAPNYVTIYYRENKGHDFGAWSYGLSKIDISIYDYFMFVNSSVIGPIVPDYYTGNWIDIFTSKITYHTKLYGSTINCAGFWTHKDPNLYAHIQSYAFCTDKIGIDILMSTKLLDIHNLSINYEDTIKNKEIKMSRDIVNAGYNIGCLLKQYDTIDFTNIKGNDFNICLENSLGINCYKNTSCHPYEIIFIKYFLTKQTDIYNNYIKI